MRSGIGGSCGRPTIGVRMALGATLGGVVNTVLRRGLALALVGCALGIGSALMVTRFTATLLFGEQLAAGTPCGTGGPDGGTPRRVNDEGHQAPDDRHRHLTGRWRQPPSENAAAHSELGLHFRSCTPRSSTRAYAAFESDGAGSGRVRWNEALDRAGG